MLGPRNITKALCLTLGCLFCAQLFPQGQEGQPSTTAAPKKAGAPSVAIMEPTVMEGSSTKVPVSAMDKFSVRGTLSDYLTRSRRFKVLDRTRIDHIAKEQSFQRQSGLVSEETIKKMGEMLGADFICTLELMREDNVFGVNVTLIDVATAEIPLSRYEMTEKYGAMEVKNLAEAIGRQILEIDRTDQAAREEEERAEQERAAAEERARLAAAERERRAAEERERRAVEEREAKEAAEREAQAAAEREAKAAADREARAVTEKARHERDALESADPAQKIARLTAFFDGSKGTLTNRALMQYLQARQQAVVSNREDYWHSVIVELRKGELLAYSKYVYTDAKNTLSHNKISAEIDGRIISLPLVTKTSKSSVVGTFTEEGPISNIEWLRIIAQSPGRVVTIRLTGPTGLTKEYVMSEKVHNAIIQTLELYDAQRRK